MAQPINPIAIAQMQKMIAKGASLNYIAQATGIAASTVRKYAGPEYRKRPNNKRTNDVGTHYTKALPQEQWTGARVLLMMIKKAKGKIQGAEIDLAQLRQAWQEEMGRW